MRAHDDAGVATDDVEQGAASLGGGLAAGEQGDPGAVLGAPEHAALGEVAEHRGDGAVVLRGEHLGGRQQRRLPPGIHRGEHGAQGDHGLARPDLALQQPVHRHVAGHLGRDGGADVGLPRGEGERQPRVERLEQPTRPHRARRGRLPGCRAPPLRERHLEDERLLEAQPPLGRLDLGHRLGGVDAAQGFGARHQLSPGSHVSRQRVGHVVEHVEHPAHALGDGPGVQLADRAVDRDQGLAVTGVEVVEHRVAGVGQLQAMVVHADGAREDAARLGHQRLLVSVRLEEGEVDVVPPVGDDDVEHGALALHHRPGRGALDLGDAHEELADLRGAQVGVTGAVAPRPEREQLTDGGDAAGRLELLGRGGDDAVELARLGGHVRSPPLTPPRPAGGRPAGRRR